MGCLDYKRKVEDNGMRVWNKVNRLDGVILLKILEQNRFARPQFSSSPTPLLFGRHLALPVFFETIICILLSFTKVIS